MGVAAQPGHAIAGPTPSSSARRSARRSARLGELGVRARAQVAVMPLDDAVADGEQSTGAGQEVERREGELLRVRPPIGRAHEHVLQDRGLVGHDAVDAEVEQAAHLGVPRRSSRRARRGRAGGRRRRSGRRRSARPLVDRHLRTAGVGARRNPGHDAGSQLANRSRTTVAVAGPRAQRGAERLADSCQPAVGERAEQMPVEDPVRSHDVDERVDDASILGSMLKRTPGCASSTSSRRGKGSVPPTFASFTTLHGRSARIVPLWSVVRPACRCGS